MPDTATYPRPAIWPVHALRRFGRRLVSARKARFAILMWAAVYPLVTVLIAASAPLLDGAPIYLRTLFASVVMVPLMVWVLQPRLARLAGTAPRPAPKAPADYCL